MPSHKPCVSYHENVFSTQAITFSVQLVLVRQRRDCRCCFEVFRVERAGLAVGARSGRRAP